MILSRIFFFLLLLLSQCGAVEQPSQATNTKRKLEVFSNDFVGITNDVIQWYGVEYMCSMSPLSEFENYKTIFGELKSEPIDPESPVDVDKNYKAKWIVKAGCLYLYDVEILNGAGKYPEKKKVLEKLTKHKFETDLKFFPENPEGVMLASWFSGAIYIKRQLKPGETYCDCMYRCEDFKKLIFEKGRFMREDLAVPGDLLVDSVEIYNNPAKYRVRKFENGRTWVYRINPCLNILEKKVKLEEYQYVFDGFTSSCNDKILWNDTTFFIEESPLSFFENYKKIYPNVPMCLAEYHLPYLMDEKNYVPKWVIVNDMLFLYDIRFLEGNHEFNREYLIRFKPIEKLTGKTFQQTPYINVKAIFADWFSGALYLKRYPEKNEKYWDRDYKCEPFYKIVLESGKIISKEKTNYMILKRKSE